MNRALLEVSNLKTYFFTRHGVVRAVDGVSFSVKAGETMGLVGESGSGKSITCLSILRLVPEPAGRIVSGRILFEGEDLLKKSSAEMRQIRGSRISMILQNPLTSLNPGFTTGAQVAEAISIHQNLRRAALWEKVKDMFRLVGISSPEMRIHDYPHQLSGGMRQRVAGAIALSCQPRLLIADEPTSSLDLTIQAQYLRLLKQMQKESNFAMIFVTHDLGIVAKVCDHVAVMYAGLIVEAATVKEIFNNPAHPYTMALLRCLPKLGQRVERLPAIEGQPRESIDVPLGCRFASRCSQAKQMCLQQLPPPVLLGSDHFVTCWLGH